MSEGAVKRYGVADRAVLQLLGGRCAAGGHGHRPGRGDPRALGRPASRSDLDWIELNEAFAAQAPAVMKQPTWISQDQPPGRHVALRPPAGATRVIRAATLMSAFQRTSARYGMISMCIGTGMGAAGIFEKV